LARSAIRATGSEHFPLKDGLHMASKG
jgi:hypothetical protein